MPMSLSSIKHQLDDHIGQRLTVVAQAGRKKITRRHGTLKETYPAVFIVDLNQDENSFERVSYSYTDLLTRSIEIEFDNSSLTAE
ncbi:Veg family protein [Lapidilactobacillus achengensis]|uniref:Veg family protein n=1 Tax=Lapidilactobacillus achengensis TaxID=2486000 RepID=A0ABW1UT28_9LACO|nr:Veg family protein [Lapidilactobacillus achengensis]